MKSNKNNGIVYSTDSGKTCPKCGHPVKSCACSKPGPAILNDGIVRIGKRPRGGKAQESPLLQEFLSTKKN